MKLKIVVFIVTLLLSVNAFATDNWIGASAANWFNGAEWSAGVPNSSVDVFINGGVFSPTVTTSGAFANNIYLGTAGGSGTLFVNSGGVLANSTAHIGYEATASGTVLVDGAGTNWKTTGMLSIGESGSGSLLITNGAVVSAYNSVMGVNGSGSGFVSVDGTGTQWNSSTSLIVSNANGSSSTVDVNDGGLISDTDAYIANSAGSTADVIISDPGSRWNNSNSLTIGNGGGVGNLTITNTGIVNVNGTGIVNINAGSSLSIGSELGGGASVAGSLNSSGVSLNDSTATILFNHTTLNYLFASPISGSGSISQVGSGTTILTGLNSYTGGTTVSAGTLQGTTNGLQGSITNNSHVIFNQTNSGTFNGTISGSGDLMKNNTGTVIFTNPNTYTGLTTINAGTLQIAADNNLGAAANPVIFGVDPLNPTAARTLAASNSITVNRNITLTNDGTVAAVGANTQLSLNNITGPGSLTVAGSGTVLITNPVSYTGNTFVDSGTLKAGVKNPFPASSLLQINNGGTFDLGGLPQSVTNLTNNGVIKVSQFVPGNTVYNQLNVTGNLKGNGTIAVSTDLVKQAGDLITVEGTTSGKQALVISDDEQSIDPAPGTAIKLVQTTDGLALFTGATDAGTYEYQVVRGDGSTATPDPHAFYLALRSSSDLSNTANAAIGMYSAGIFLYYSDLQTLIQRMGELRLGDTSGIWIKPDGTRITYNNQASREFNQTSGGLNFGVDRGFNAAFGGHLNVGLYGGYLYASDDFHNSTTGSIQGLSAALYATWLHAGGWYVDTVAKYSELWNSFQAATTSGINATANYAVPAMGASVETGKRFNFHSKKHSYFLEPELQLETVFIDGNNYTASNGLVVNGDNQHSLQGRAGLRTGIHFDLPHNKAIEPYVEASVLQEFLGHNRIITNTTAFTTIYPPTVGRFSAGFAAQIAKSAFAYGEYDYAFGKGFHEPAAMSIGVRLTA